ncbi:hypothetical protein HPG69_010267, partial [Diceros bicornis minor]
KYHFSYTAPTCATLSSIHTVTVFGVLILAGEVIFHSFLLSYLGTEFQSPSLIIQEGIQRSSSQRPHPVESESSWMFNTAFYVSLNTEHKMVIKLNGVAAVLLYQLGNPQHFCEIKQVVQLACSDTSLNVTIMYFTAVVLGSGPLADILYTYAKTVSSICGIFSAQRKYKAFSTFVSHLSIVSLYYCSSLGVYLISSPTHSSHSSGTATVMYTVVTPMLNPFIYSLRNRDIQGALKRVIHMDLMWDFNTKCLYLREANNEFRGLNSSFNFHHQPFREGFRLPRKDLPLRVPI